MTPAVAITQLLTQTGYGITPTGKAVDVWPVYFSGLPDGSSVPDNCICVYDTAGKTQGRYMRNGKTVSFPGIQIKVRANDYETAFRKIAAIAGLLDSTNRVSVSKGSDIVTIASITRGNPISIGKELGNRPRDAFTINAILSFV